MQAKISKKFFSMIEKNDFFNRTVEINEIIKRLNSRPIINIVCGGNDTGKSRLLNHVLYEKYNNINGVKSKSSEIISFTKLPFSELDNTVLKKKKLIRSLHCSLNNENVLNEEYSYHNKKEKSKNNFLTDRI